MKRDVKEHSVEDVLKLGTADQMISTITANIRVRCATIPFSHHRKHYRLRNGIFSKPVLLPTQRRP